MNDPASLGAAAGSCATSKHGAFGARPPSPSGRPSRPEQRQRELSPKVGELAQTNQTKEQNMESTRKTAIVAGVFFLITEVTAILGLLLYGSVLSDPHFIVSASVDDTGVLGGAFLEVLLAIAVVGTGVTLYPVIRRQHEGIALGHVAGRLIEATIIAVGAISLLAVVSMRQHLAGATGAEAGAAVTVGQALVAVHNWTFLFGPKLALGVNTVLLAYLMYRSRLVPRAIAVLGLVGGALVFASGTAVLFGAYEDLSIAGFGAAVPVFAWEVSLAVWMIVKGFKPSPVTAGTSAPSTRPGYRAAAV